MSRKRSAALSDADFLGPRMVGTDEMSSTDRLVRMHIGSPCRLRCLMFARSSHATIYSKARQIKRIFWQGINVLQIFQWGTKREQRVHAPQTHANLMITSYHLPTRTPADSKRCRCLRLKGPLRWVRTYGVFLRIHRHPWRLAVVSFAFWLPKCEQFMKGEGPRVRKESLIGESKDRRHER